MLTGKKSCLSAVNQDSLSQLREWRNDPDMRKYFREYREISDTMQNNWYNKITSDPNQVNFEIHASIHGNICNSHQPLNQSYHQVHILY